MARGGHGLPKVSPGPAMPDPSTPWGRATPEKPLRPFKGVALPQGGRPAAVFFPFGHPTSYACDDGGDRIHEINFWSHEIWMTVKELGWRRGESQGESRGVRRQGMRQGTGTQDGSKMGLFLDSVSYGLDQPQPLYALRAAIRGPSY
jgi:hypothetical protein